MATATATATTTAGGIGGFSDPDSITCGAAYTDEETEQAVLIAASQGHLAEVVAAADERMFIHGPHRVIFRALKALASEGCVEADPLTVRNKLKELGEQSVDVADILSTYMLAYHVTDYARHLRTLQGRWAAREGVRRLEAAARELAGGGPGALPATIHVLQSFIDELRAIDEGVAGPGSTLADAKRAARERANAGGRRVPTGFPGLDDALGGGLGPGELFVVGARPSVGKSTLGQSIATAVARQGGEALFVSMEMADHEIGRRQLAAEPGLSMASAARPDSSLSEGELAAVGRSLADGRDERVHICQCSGIEDIEAEAARRVAGREGAVVVIDYLQLIDRPDGRVPETEAIGRVTRRLKKLALRLGVAVVALSQLSRNSAAERRQPQLSDLRGSGCIEQDADEVLLLSRKLDGADDAGAAGERAIVFDLQKNRQGELARFERIFDPAHMRFAEVRRYTDEQW